MQSTGADRIDSRKLNQCIKSPKSKPAKLFKTSEEGRKNFLRRELLLCPQRRLSSSTDSSSLHFTHLPSLAPRRSLSHLLHRHSWSRDRHRSLSRCFRPF